MESWRYWDVWAGVEWIAAVVALLYVLGDVLPRLGFFVLSSGRQTVVIPQNRIVISAPSYFARFFEWQGIDLYGVLLWSAIVFTPVSAFESQASYLRISRQQCELHARLSGWFGVLPFTQRISVADISSLRAGHVTTRTTSNRQTGVHISSQTRYELILSGSFGARRLQFGSAEARDLAISVIQELKRANGSQAQELTEASAA